MMKIDWIEILKKAAFWNHSNTLPMACERDAGSSACQCERRSVCQAETFNDERCSNDRNARFRDNPCKYRRAKCMECGPMTAKSANESRWEGGDEW